MKHNHNPKVIATGLFNVADQINALDGVRDSLRSLSHIVMDNGQFRIGQALKGKPSSLFEVIKKLKLIWKNVEHLYMQE